MIRFPFLAITRLVPTVTDQGQDDDQTVEELNVGTSDTHCHDATLDERTMSAPMAPPAMVPMPPQVGAPPTRPIQEPAALAFTGCREPGEVEPLGEAGGQRSAEHFSASGKGEARCHG
jgi:hypothetical protein